MKKIILILITVILHYYPMAQTWPKYYGKPGIDVSSYDFIENYDKGFLIIGAYGNVAWLIKTDINGDTLWSKILKNTGNNFFTGICPTQDGGFLGCGVLDFSTTEDMPYVVKFDACGEKEWCRYFTGSVIELPWADDIGVDANGDIIVTVNQFGYFPTETMHLFKLDSEGNLLWKKPYCSTYPEGAIPLSYDLFITTTGKYIISGSVYWEDPWNPGGIKALRSLFVCVDSVGNEEWVLPFGLQDTLLGIGLDVIENIDGSLIGVGKIRNLQDYDEGFIVKIDSTGNVIKYNIINAKEIDTLYNRVLFYQIIDFDTIIAFGGTIGVEEVGNPPMETISDAHIFADSVNFIKCHQYTDFKTSYQLKKSYDNKLISESHFKNNDDWQITLSKLNLNLEFDTAYMGNYTYDSLCPHPVQSGFINLDDCQLVDIKEIPSPEQYYARIKTIPITVYPNPATDNVHFKLENTEHNKNIQLKCFNLLGTEVYHTSIIPGQKEAAADVSGWQEGMYMVVVYSEGKVVGKAKMVVWK